jgi:hypothetical protein
MASPTSPTHGKYGALYVLRPNGFESVAASTGLNDLTWGTGSTAAASTVYKVTIDHVGAADSFTWTVDGAGGAADVEITGAEQTLADGQKLIFAAVTGHSVGDSWTIGNLKDEATTEATVYAQITAAANRLLNPNAPPTFTDDGGKGVIKINYTNGTATFNGNVGNVTVTGNNGMVMEASLQKVAYLIDWSLSVQLDIADASIMGASWKTACVGQAGATGSCNAYFIANQTLLNCLTAALNAGSKYFLLELFNYDPDSDQTGDHILAWASFTGFSVGADIGSVVKESLNFQVVGEMSFVENV